MNPQTWQDKTKGPDPLGIRASVKQSVEETYRLVRWYACLSRTREPPIAIGHPAAALQARLHLGAHERRDTRAGACVDGNGKATHVMASLEKLLNEFDRGAM